jgi:hypothetical protein
MKNINSIFTFNNGVPTGVTAIVGNRQFTANSTHANWQGILTAIRANNSDALIKAIDIKTRFTNYTIGNVRIVGNEVFAGSTKLGGVVVDRIFSFMENKLPVQPVLAFISKLQNNPSSRAVNELYRFLEHENLPLTTEGNFRAYKGLESNFYSCTAGKLELIQGRADASGRIFNGVGETIECPRNQVNDDKDQTCSYGLHAGSLEYARGFSQGKLVVVEIDPADVISIPSDCDGQKLRTCKYKVVEEFKDALDSTYVQTATVIPAPAVDNDADTESADYQAGYDSGYDSGFCDGEDGAEYDNGNVDMETSEWALGFDDGYYTGYNEGIATKGAFNPNYHNKRNRLGQFAPK